MNTIVQTTALNTRTVQLENQRGGTLLREANREWMTRPADQRFETLSALRESVASRRNLSRAEDIDLGDIIITGESGDGLTVTAQDRLLRPSNWAFGQLAQRAKAPAGYLRTLPATIAAQALQASIGRTAHEVEGLKFLRIQALEDEPDTLQAVTSRTYGRIWDADVVDAVQRIVERTNGRFFNPLDWSRRPSGLYASDHDVFVFMVDGGSIVDGGGERDALHRGFIVSNSETGARTFSLMTFLFRVVCGNHLIWDATDVSKVLIRHTQGGPGRFDRDALPALQAYVDASPRPAEEAITRAKAKLLRDLVNLPGQTVSADPLSVDWVNGFAAKHGFSRPEVREAITFAKAEEGRCETLWDLVNGFTASARAIEFADARTHLEKRAGELMALAV